MVEFLLFWVICGCAGTNLIHRLSVVHQDLEKYEPHHVYLTVAAGPIGLIIFSFIGISYALKGKTDGPI